MYHIMAIANYEDRFVIPTAHREVMKTPTTCAAPAASRSATDAQAGKRNRISSPAEARKNPMEIA
jgi:nitrate reductase / nitrite oxidoreductase, beta subunit